MPTIETDSLVIYRLQEIKDTISIVAANTSPIRDLDGYYSYTDGKVAIVALLVAIIAAVSSILCFFYQRRSAILLERANHRRPSLYPLVKKLYDNSILLQILLEYDSDYNMSYTAESKLSIDKRSSSKKRFFYHKCKHEYLLSQIFLPENVIILGKYEIYPQSDIYNLAYAVHGDISLYNKCIANLCQHMNSKENDDVINDDRESLFTLVRRLIKELLFLDELVIDAESHWYNILFFKKDTKYLQKEISFYIISRLFSSLKNITKEVVLSDPNLIIDANVIDFDVNISYRDFLKKKALIDNSYKTHKLLFLEFVRKWALIKKNQWIDKKWAGEMKYIRKLKDPDRVQLKTNFYSSDVLFRQIKEDKGNVEPIKNMIKECFGDIYEVIKVQILSGEFDMKAILKFDILSQIALTKHNLLLKMGKRDYDNEYRRIEKKSLWFQQKNKRLDIS